MEKVAAQAARDQLEEVRKYMMATGVREIVAKIFDNDDFIYDVARLMPKL